jgi:hypothetical protein
MKNKSLGYFFMLIALLLMSCSISVEKRRYRPGYHVEVNSPKKMEQANRLEKNQVVKTSDPSVPMEIVVIPQRTENKYEVEPTPISQKETRPKNSSTKLKYVNPLLDSCDVIFTAVGERIEARIIEIGDEYVHYKRCDDPKGRLYSIQTKMIDNITLRNGELFIPKDRVIVDKEKLRKRSQTLFVASIVSVSFALIGFIFSFFIAPFSAISLTLLILSGIFSFVLVLMDVKPGRFVPSYRTKLTWIFYLVVLLLVIVGLVLLFI